MVKDKTKPNPNQPRPAFGSRELGNESRDKEEPSSELPSEWGTE